MKTNYEILLEKELDSFIDKDTHLLCADVSRSIACPLCGMSEKQQRELFIKRGYRFILCIECGLIFVNPMLKSEINQHLYDTSDSLKEWVNILQTESQREFDLALYNSIAALIRPYMETPSLSCLDISIRGGLASECTAFSSWPLYFFDFSQITRLHGQSKYPQRTFIDNFEEIVASNKRYDIVISMEAIEHFIDPVTFMRNIDMLLTDRGIYCGVLSNAESLLVRIFGQQAPLFDGLYQKYFFHTASLRRLLENIGFEDIIFRTEIPCTHKIFSYLNNMIYAHVTPLSNQAMRAVSALAETQPLGYKLLFAAKKGRFQNNARD